MRFDPDIVLDAWHVAEFRRYARNFRITHAAILVASMGILVYLRVIGAHGLLAAAPVLPALYACVRLAQHGRDDRLADAAAEDWANEVAKVLSPTLHVPLDEARAFGQALPDELITDDRHGGYLVRGAVGEKPHVLRIRRDGSFSISPFPIGDALA